MTTSPKTTSMYRPKSGEKIPDWTISYFRQRNRNRLHSLVLSALKKAGITQAEVARRLGKRTDVVCRLIGAPGNWTSDTASDLLLAIGGLEAEYSINDPFNAVRRNYNGPEWLSRQSAAASTVISLNTTLPESKSTGMAMTVKNKEPSLAAI